jgi:hypothetical protein
LPIKNKMKTDTVLAGALFVVATTYLLKRRLGSILVWLSISTLIALYGFRLPASLAVAAGIAVVYVISVMTARTWEGFDDEVTEKEEKKDSPSPAPPKTGDPHVDVGTTILHAYRNLTPEQIGGMRRDTRELLELQKELMGSLSEMKPAIEQGAELLSTFSTFFGDQQK